LDEALPIAARRGRAASAARRRKKIVNGTSDEGSDDDEVDVGPARRKYGTSAASDNDEAGATVKRLACAARLRLGRKVTHTAARCSGATKVARHMGGGEVAADTWRDDVSIEDAYSVIDAGVDTDDDAGGRGAKKRPYSPQDYSTDHNVDEEAMSTDNATPKAAYAAAARRAAAQRAVTQRGKGNLKADHKATSEADQVEDSGKEGRLQGQAENPSYEEPGRRGSAAQIFQGGISRVQGRRQG
jgi:hypothetical protein